MKTLQIVLRLIAAIAAVGVALVFLRAASSTDEPQRDILIAGARHGGLRGALPVAPDGHGLSS